MSYVRIIGAVVAAALLAFLWWRVSLSFAQAEEIEAKDAQITTLTAAAARDTRIARELADFRSQQSDFSQWFREEAAKQPLTREVVRYVNPNTGEKVVCRERDPVRYRGLFNAAVTGTAGVP
jgi:hypothetical protein